MNNRPPARRPAFTLIELLVVIAIIAVLIAILVPSLLGARRAGRMVVCQSNIRQIGTAMLTYGADHDERIATFSWQAEADYGYGRLGSAVSAAKAQAGRILLEQTGIRGIERINIRDPHIHHSYLVMLDYLSGQLTEPVIICPEDSQRREWQSDLDGFESLPDSIRPTSGTGIDALQWPFSGTYELTPAAHSEPTGGPSSMTIRQHGLEHDHYKYGDKPMGRRNIREITFPSQKVAMLDPRARHFGKKELFFAYPEAKQPLLFWDGHVAVVRTGDTNPGFRPNNPTTDAPTQMFYAPDPWESPTLSGMQRDRLNGHFRWTRGALTGIDIGGDEVNTGNS